MSGAEEASASTQAANSGDPNETASVARREPSGIRTGRRPGSARNRRASLSLRITASSVLTIGILAWALECARQAFRSHPGAAWPAVRTTLGWLPIAASNAPRNVGTALLVMVLCGAMWGPGTLLLRPLGVRSTDRWENVVFPISAGLAGWVPIVLFFGWAIGLSRTDILIPTIVYISPTPVLLLLAVRRHRRLPITGQTKIRWSAVPWIEITLLLIGAILLYLALLGALAPEIEFDARWYHLGSAFHYIEVGHFYNIVAATHDPAMGLNPYQEISYTGLFALFGVHGAKILAFVDGALIFGAMVAFARVHLRSTLVGIFAGLAFLSLPIATWSATTAYNDLPVALYTLLSVHALGYWLRDREQWGWAYLSVAMAAFSLGVKAFGAFTLIIALATIIAVTFVPKFSRNWANVFRLCICGFTICVICAAWWIREGAMTGNPIFPVVNQIFKSQYWNAFAAHAADSDYRHVSLIKLPIELPSSLWYIVTQPASYNTLVGPFFLIALPVSLVLVICTRGRPRPAIFLLAAYVVVWSAAWYLSAVTDSRYLLGIAPLACLLVAQSVADALARPRFTMLVPVMSFSILVFVGVSTLQPFVPFEKVTTPNVVLGSVPYEWNYLFRGEPENDVQLRFIPIAEYINAHLNPRTTKIYDDAGLNGIYLYLDPELFNGTGYGSPTVMKEWSLSSADAYTHLTANGISDVVIRKASLSNLLHLPISSHLRIQYQSPDGFVLLRVIH